MYPETEKKLSAEYKYMGNRLLSNLITLVKVSLFLLVVFAISIAIVYPLWNIATTNKILYSKIVLLTIGSLFTAFILYKMISYIVKNGLANFFTVKVSSFFKKLFIVFIIAVLLMLILILQSLILKVFAIISFFIVIFLVTGYFKFAKKK